MNLLKLCYAAALSSALTVSLALPTSAQTTYRYGNGRVVEGILPLELDYYAADEICETPRPTALMIHGGGFRNGTRKRDTWQQIGRFLNANGYNAASMDYRLIPDQPLPGLNLTNTLSAPNEQRNAANAAFEDAATAMRWLVTNAETLCVDPDQLILIGESAGAIAALYAAYALDHTNIQRPSPMAVVSFWGGYLPPRAMQRGEASLFLMHGTDDITVPFEQSAILAKTANSLAIPVHLHRVIEGGHGFNDIDPFKTTLNDAPMMDHILGFLEAARTKSPYKSRQTKSRARK